MSEPIHFQLLTGRRVLDVNGKVVGLLQTAFAERKDNHYYVTEYLVGAAAFLTVLGISVGRMIGVPSRYKPLRVPWQQLDLSDPENLRLRCTKNELVALQRD
jgi:hypothetical protein